MTWRAFYRQSRVRILSEDGLRVILMTMKTLVAFLLVVSGFSTAFAQGRYLPQKRDTRLTYDLSASTGSTNGYSYTEINLGLNWFFTDWASWRNAAFSRQGQGMQSVQGLDSSLRFNGSLGADDSPFGVDAFAGPGVRVATNKYNAAFGEAGLVFRLGGIRLGAGVKALSYFADREIDGVSIPKNESQYFIIIGGGGAL